MNEDTRRSKSRWTCTDGRDVSYEMHVKGHGTLQLRIVTINNETGEVEFRAAIREHTA